MDENKYAIKLRCVNCYENFEEEFPKGHEAKEEGFGDFHFLRKPLNNNCENIECPNCGCTNIRKSLREGRI